MVGRAPDGIDHRSRHERDAGQNETSRQREIAERWQIRSRHPGHDAAGAEWISTTLTWKHVTPRLAPIRIAMRSRRGAR